MARPRRLKTLAEFTPMELQSLDGLMEFNAILLHNLANDLINEKKAKVMMELVSKQKPIVETAVLERKISQMEGMLGIDE